MLSVVRASLGCLRKALRDSLHIQTPGRNHPFQPSLFRHESIRKFINAISNLFQSFVAKTALYHARDPLQSLQPPNPLPLKHFHQALTLPLQTLLAHLSPIPHPLLHAHTSLLLAQPASRSHQLRAQTSGRRLWRSEEYGVEVDGGPGVRGSEVL